VLAGRSPGVHLTAQGHEQAKHLATFLARGRIDRIFTSPLERAVETAAPLAEAKRLAPASNVALHETDLGDWTGKKPSELESDRAFLRFNQFRSGTSAPGGETMLAVQARVVGMMLRWRDEHLNETLVLVSHAEPIRAALLYFAGASLDHWQRIPVDLASISTVLLDRDTALITRMNCRPE
jgi:probable phosphoglycerate mutase